MGIIFSKPVNYVRTKVNNTKQSIRTRVDNTKRAVQTRIDNTRNAVYTKVDNTRNAIYDRVDNTKTAIKTRAHNTHTRVKNTGTAVYRTVDDTATGFVRKVNGCCLAVYNTVVGIKTGIQNVVEQTVTAVTNFKNAVVTKTVNTKNAVVKRVTDTRDYACLKYSNTKSYVYTKYRQAREAKLTRWQKVKYGTLLLTVLTLLMIGMLCILDCYMGNYDRAQERIDGVVDFTTATVQHTWMVLTTLIEYLLWGTRLTLEYVFYGLKVTCVQLWEWMKVVSAYTWECTKVAAQYTYLGARTGLYYFGQGCKLVGQYLYLGLETICYYTWTGTCTVAEYTCHASRVGFAYFCQGAAIAFEYGCAGSEVAWDYVKAGSQTGAEYTVTGSKIAADYTLQGTKYALKHGAILLKDGTVGFFWWLSYFLTNFRAASYELAIHMWHGAQWLAVNLVSGTYYGSIVLFDWTYYAVQKAYFGSVYALDKGYHGTVSFAQWSQSASTTSYEVTAAALVHIAECISKGATTTFTFLCSAILFVVHGITSSCYWLYCCVAIATQCSIQWTTDLAQFLWEWTYAITTTVSKVTYSSITKGSHALYVGLNQYGLNWGYIFLNKVGEWSYICGQILLKFLADLVAYVGNFIYVTGLHIYNLLYIIFLFFSKVLGASLHIVNLVMKALVYCTTGIFGGVIFFLRETIMAYMFMLQKYNTYREILFGAFVVLISVYCTGLMRDRSRSMDEEDEDGSESDSEGEDEGDGNAPRYLREKDLALPPIYQERPHKHLPAYNEISDDTSDEHAEPEEREVSKSDDVMDHTIEESDLEFDFDLDPDQEVPDFMGSSASEREVDSPKPHPDGEHEVPSGSDLDHDLQNEGEGYDLEDAREPDESEGSVSEDDADHDPEGLLERVEIIRSQREQLDESSSSNPCADEHDLDNELNEKCEEEELTDGATS